MLYSTCITTNVVHRTCKVIQLKLHLFIPVKGHKKLKSDLTGFGSFQFELLTSYCELKRTYVPNVCEIG